MTSVGVHPVHQGIHVTVSVFIGPDLEHRALAGSLVVRAEEWPELERRLTDTEEGMLDRWPDDTLREMADVLGQAALHYIGVDPAMALRMDQARAVFRTEEKSRERRRRGEPTPLESAAQLDLIRAIKAEMKRPLS